jgi:signal transduction histidine kinase
MLAGVNLSSSTNKVLEVNTVKKDGSEIVVELTIIPIKQDDKQFYCSFMRDITERKKHELEMIDINANLEEKIQERTNLLESTIKELDAFSYSVSHDLRSPLRGIDGWSLALLEDYGDQLDETAHEYLNRVRKETQRMGTLIDDLLKLSKYDFNTDVDVNILGHIFEHSLSEIEEVEASLKGEIADKTKGKRKKDGVFYTPKYITKYIDKEIIKNAGV